MGVNLKKVEKMAQRREARRKYKQFFKDNDFRDVREYFEIALEAEIMINHTTGKLLTKNDDLMFGFFTDQYGNLLLDAKDRHKAVYQYTFRRQPINQQASNNNKLIQQLQQQGIL